MKTFKRSAKVKYAAKLARESAQVGRVAPRAPSFADQPSYVTPQAGGATEAQARHGASPADSTIQPFNDSTCEA
jgi:hypothetical protein